MKPIQLFHGRKKKKMIRFNLSASSLNLYKESPYQFYLQYIMKEEPDTKVNQVYGQSGNALHHTLEFYDPDTHTVDKVREFFDKEWDSFNLDEKTGFNGKSLSKEQYWKGVLRGMEIMKKHAILEKEKEIILPFVKRKNIEINLKGYIDCLIIDREDNSVKVLDWKTSSSADNDEEKFRFQARMYCYLMWKKEKELVKEAVFEFVKIGETRKYRFTDDEIMYFGEELEEYDEGNPFESEVLFQFPVGRMEQSFQPIQEEMSETV